MFHLQLRSISGWHHYSLTTHFTEDLVCFVTAESTPKMSKLKQPVEQPLISTELTASAQTPCAAMTKAF